MKQGEARAWRQTGAMPLTARLEQILQIIEKSGRGMNGADCALEFMKRFRAKHRPHVPQKLSAVQPQKHRAFTVSVWNTELDPHEESIELRFRQRKRADLLLRVLRCKNEKRGGQGMRYAIHRNVVFFHRLEQRALCFRSRPIDFVNQHDLGKKRPAMKNEALLFPIENRVADNIGREQIAGELNAPKLQPQRSRHGVRKCRLAYSRNVLDQQMSARQETGYRQGNGVMLADDNFADL